MRGRRTRVRYFGPAFGAEPGREKLEPEPRKRPARQVTTPPADDKRRLRGGTLSNASKRSNFMVDHAPPGYLPVECWCRAEVVHVPQREVAMVLTRSCGLPGCKRPMPPAAA